MIMSLFIRKSAPSSHRKGKAAWLAATSLCSILALSGCATTDTGSAEHGSESAEEAQVSEPSLREAAIESIKTQDYVAAAAYWGALYERNANDPEVAVSYSRALRQIGSIQQALNVMQRSQVLHPDHADVMAEYGKALTASGRPDQASAMLRSEEH